jgi:hypothetical protein
MMSGRARAMLPMVLVGLLASPQTAKAGLADIIWEMSGPQLFGIGLECEFASLQPPLCRSLFWEFGPPHGKHLWFNAEARVYFSGNKDHGDVDFTFWGTRMIGIDPMIGFGGYRLGRFRFHHGVGASLNRLFGEDVDDAFNNIAWKLRFIDVKIDLPKRLRLDIAYNGRLYPKGFDASASPRELLHLGSDTEYVHGALIAILF